jgi:hypothetical protein
MGREWMPASEKLKMVVWGNCYGDSRCRVFVVVLEVDLSRWLDLTSPNQGRGLSEHFHFRDFCRHAGTMTAVG